MNKMHCLDRARKFISTYEDMAELIRLGAYRRGSNPEVDEAIYYYPRIEEFMRQTKDDHSDLATSYSLLADVLAPPEDPVAALEADLQAETAGAQPVAGTLDQAEVVPVPQMLAGPQVAE